MPYLTHKYPFPQSNHWFRDSILYGAIVFLILYLLQPFGFSWFPGNKLLTSLAFGSVTTGCQIVYTHLVLGPMVHHLQPWRIWHQALAILGLILFIAIGNFLLFSCIFPHSITFGAFFLFFYWTLIIGLIITAISITVSYNRHLKGRLETLLEKTTEKQTDILITIRDTTVRGDDLQLRINDLLYIEAQKNNVKVCHIKDGKATSTDVHTTLSAVLDDLKSYDNIFQCHRSFVVNLNNITSAQGNSNGYQLQLGGCPTTVPVSRTYVPKLRSFIA